MARNCGNGILVFFLCPNYVLYLGHGLVITKKAISFNLLEKKIAIGMRYTPFLSNHPQKAKKSQFIFLFRS